jgi:hypothetical protein
VSRDLVRAQMCAALQQGLILAQLSRGATPNTHSGKKKPDNSF